MANALFWLGDIVGTIAIRKSICCLRCRGDAMFAAGTALSLVGYNKGYLGNTAAARGWLSRAARIINSEVPGCGGNFSGRPHMLRTIRSRSEALARQAAEIGRANGNSDLELMAMHAVGQALVQQGRTRRACRCCRADADLGVKAARTGPRNLGRLTKRDQEVLVLLGEGLLQPRDRQALVPVAQNGRASRGTHLGQARSARTCSSRRARGAKRPLNLSQSR